MRIFPLALIGVVSLSSLVFVACGSELGDDPGPPPGSGGRGGSAGSAGKAGAGGGGGGGGAGGSPQAGAGGSPQAGAGGAPQGGSGGAPQAGAGGAGGAGGGVAGAGGGTSGAGGSGGGGAKLPNFCNVQYPHTFCSAPGATKQTVYGQVNVVGRTDQATLGAGIEAEIGVGPKATDPRTAPDWVFTPATPNPGFNTATQPNDEYQAELTAPGAPTTLSYVYRFRVDGGPFQYCDTDGVTDDPGNLPFDVGKLGTWTVQTAACPPPTP